MQCYTTAKRREDSREHYVIHYTVDHAPTSAISSFQSPIFDCKRCNSARSSRTQTVSPISKCGKSTCVRIWGYTKLMPLWENGQPADNSLGYFNSAVLRETPLHIYHNYAHYTLVKTSRLKLKMTSLLYHTTASLDSLHTTVLTTPMQPMNYTKNRKSMITWWGNVLIYITCPL